MSVQPSPDAKTPFPPWELGGRAQEEPHEAPPPLHSRTPPRPPFPAPIQAPRPHSHWLRHPDHAHGPEGADQRRSPAPAHPLAFDASDPPIETAARGLAERRQRPAGEAAARGLALSEAFGTAPVALFPRTWLLLRSAARRVSQSSFHPIIGLVLHRSLARGHSPQLTEGKTEAGPFLPPSHLSCRSHPPRALPAAPLCLTETADANGIQE